MTIILPQDSGEPLYRQVKSALESAVLNGQFTHASLPSSRALALELGLSRNTINLAYQEMVAEGLIVSEERVGYRANVSMLKAEPEIENEVENESDTGAAGSVDWSRRLRPRADANVSEIQKDYDWHAYPYPFIYGQVASSDFPITAWNRALRTSMEFPHVNMSLRDGGSEDDPMLVEQLRRSVLVARGIRAAPEEVLITLGAQNGLFLACRALLGPGDEVAVENPGYPDAVHIVAGMGATPRPVGVDAEGIRVMDIPDTAKVISVTPSHQFPTNVSLSNERRTALLDLARQNNALILEDDYDAELRYVGRPAPALRAADRERIVYVGSFSKMLAPGLRIGYVVAAPELIERMRHDRRYSVRHPPGQVQRALALMISSGDYQRAQRKQRAGFKAKWALMASTLSHILGDEFIPPTGGTSMWVPLPDGVVADRIVAEAARQGVLIESGAASFAEGHPDRQSYIRIGYSAIPIESIVPGLRVLSRVIYDERRRN